jgi:hypothetical protein
MRSAIDDKFTQKSPGEEVMNNEIGGQPITARRDLSAATR